MQILHDARGHARTDALRPNLARSRPRRYERWKYAGAASDLCGLVLFFSACLPVCVRVSLRSWVWRCVGEGRSLANSRSLGFLYFLGLVIVLVGSCLSACLVVRYFVQLCFALMVFVVVRR